MAFRLLYFDEMRGFYKSYVMLALWVGLPALTIALHFIRPELEGVSLSYVVSIVIAGIGGPLAAVSLSTSIASEKNQKVYDFFLIRPVRRSSLVLAKFAAIYTCLLTATTISVMSGLLFDAFTIGLTPDLLTHGIVTSLIISLSAISVSCSAAILIGVMLASVALTAIVALFVGDMLMLLPLLPSLINPSADPVPIAVLFGISFTAVLLATTVYAFNHKQF